ncbi:PucR family transcriptional regulator [Microbacterium sp. YY-01]|uniref:PucR family transcriptional regulator n=1 Tax=Microbacterium sp. YY-01 TaxID=3421634 RepID=UPI003D181912
MSAEIQRVARALLKHFDALMSTITNRVWQTVPAYSAQLLERVDLTDRIRDNVHNVIMCMFEDRPPVPDELERAARAGERRALQGISHISIVQSFRTAERVLNDEYHSWCARMQVRDESARAGRDSMVAALDSLEAAMLSAYSAMQHQITVSNALTEPTLFRRLAEGDTIHPDEVEQLARVLELEDAEESEFIAFAATIIDDAEQFSVDRMRLRLVAALSTITGTPTLSGIVRQQHPVPSSASTATQALFALPCTSPSDEFLSIVQQALTEASLVTSVRAAIGEPRTGLSQIGVSARQALAALAATEQGTHTPGVLRYVDRLMEVFTHRDLGFARALRSRYLEPLGGGDLEETLRAYTAHELSMGETAKALHVHKNTVVYRLRRIEELTGLNLRHARDITRAVLAIEASDALDASSRSL